VPNWQEAPAIVQRWLNPTNAEALDKLQAYNIAWYQNFKQQIRIDLARAIRTRL